MSSSSSSLPDINMLGGKSRSAFSSKKTYWGITPSGASEGPEMKVNESGEISIVFHNNLCNNDHESKNDDYNILDEFLKSKQRENILNSYDINCEYIEEMSDKNIITVEFKNKNIDKIIEMYEEFSDNVSQLNIDHSKYVFLVAEGKK